MNPEDLVEQRIEVWSERAIVVKNIHVQPLAGKYARRQIHLASMINQRARPTLPRNNEEKNEENNQRGQDASVFIGSESNWNVHFDVAVGPAMARPKRRWRTIA